MNQLNVGAAKYYSEQTSFTYVVKSCSGLNVLREKDGDDPIVCASTEDVTAAADDFEVNIVIVNQYFN